MKKLISIWLALMAAGLLAVSASAANTTESSTSISAKISPAYTVNIPETLEIPYHSAEPEPLELQASGLVLETGKTVTVTAAGSGAGGAFTMVNGDKTISYELSLTPAPWNAVPKNGEVASFDGDGISTIYAKVPDWDMSAAGKYSGTITFTVAYH